MQTLMQTCMVSSIKIPQSISHAELLTNGPALRDNKFEPRGPGYLWKKSRGLSMCSEGIMAASGLRWNPRSYWSRAEQILYCILLHFIAYFQGFERHMNNAYIYIYTQFMMPGSVSFDDIRNLICSHLHQNIELKYCNPRSKFMISCIELDSFFVSVHECMRIDEFRLR